MSTRTNIVIELGQTSVILYRHYDGYPSCTGLNLAELLVTHQKAGDFLRAILAEQYEESRFDDGTPHRPARPIYELTTGIHGDIEYLYRIKFPEHWSKPAKLPEIGVEAFGFSDEDCKRRESTLPNSVTVGPLSAFVDLVNAEIRVREILAARAISAWSDMPRSTALADTNRRPK
jgi:hypothetical protein